MSVQSPLAYASWVRSSACVGESHCVEVARVDSGVAIRDSKAPEIALVFDNVAWQDFADAIKAGEILR